MEKIALVCDPGIDGAFAVALALHDPDIDVLGLAATAGNVSADQATNNIHVLIEQLDPPRWPRLGAAPAVNYDRDGTHLHGPHGLGGSDFPCAVKHHLAASEKLLVDLVRNNPREVTVVSLGPLTVLARACDLYPDLPKAVKRFVCLGGAWHEPGNAGPVSEFHFHCDPLSARQIMQCGAPMTLIPLDVMRKVLFSPSDLLGLPVDSSKACRFLRQIVPFGIAATSNLYGIEGFHLKDVLGIIAVAAPAALSTKHMRMDVETRGELTRGMSVFDQRHWVQNIPNVDLAVDVDTKAVRAYIERILKLKD
ncbi:MAG: nucleoside hydrolase [Gemmataceae bacterium]|nr:nucleoside hydrolase [Gemmataceae bacterium]